MLFGANFPHPTFVNQAIGTHGQSGIPDMLEMLLVVQFIQIALHSSVGRAGQLHRIGKNPVMGLFTAKFPCIVGLGDVYKRQSADSTGKGADAGTVNLHKILVGFLNYKRLDRVAFPPEIM